MSATYEDRIRGLTTAVAYKAPCRVATIANITLSGLQTINGVAVVADDRVLVKDQTDTTENGIWVAGTAAWARALDFNGSRDVVQGTQVLVTNGSVMGSGLFILTTANPVVGSSGLVFQETGFSVSDAVAQGNVPVYSTVAAVEALAIPVGITGIRVNGRSTQGDSGDQFAVEVSDPGDPLPAGVFTSNVGTRFWKNAENEVRPEQFADWEEMFSSDVLARRYSMRDGTYEVTAPLTIPDYGVVIMADEATFSAGYAQESGSYNTPIITVGAGVSINRLILTNDGGVTPITTGVRLGTRVRAGVIELMADDYNNNVIDTSTGYENRAAVRIDGNDVKVDFIKTYNHRTAIRVTDCDDIEIGKIRLERCSLGLNPRNVFKFSVNSGLITSIPFSEQTRAWNSNGLITGENGILVGGVHDGVFKNIRIEDTLEHGIRIGAGIGRTNEHLEFTNISINRTYGCGFKADDGDASTTTDIRIVGIDCVDIGRDNEVATGGEGGVEYDPVETSEWGNKEAVAIRNVERVYVGGLSTRVEDYTYCGRYGLWFERCSGITANGVAVSDAQLDGVSLTPNGSDMRNVVLTGVVTHNNGRDGLALRAVHDGDVVNRVIVGGLMAADNAEWGVRVDARPDTTSPISGPVSITGYARGNPSGAFTIAAAVTAAADFSNGIRSRKDRESLQNTVGYNPGEIGAGATGATTTIAVTGAEVGDLVTVTGPGASAGITWLGTVSAADTVTCHPINPTGSPVDPVENSLTARVWKL